MRPRYTAGQEAEGDQYAVAVAMTVHAIIKANDALTWKFLSPVAGRHDEARLLFEELIQRGFVKPQYANYRNIIQDAISNKAKAEYRGSYFSKNDYDFMRRQAEKFLTLAKDIVL